MPPPSAQYRSINGGRVFQADVPANWTSLPSSSAIKVVPQNGYGQLKGRTVFSHGVEFGVAQAAHARSAGGDQHVAASGRAEQPRAARSPANSRRLTDLAAVGDRDAAREPVAARRAGARSALYTTFLADGTLFYYLTIVPERDAAAFQNAFRRVASRSD